MISAIAAVGNNWQLGLDGDLPWPKHKADMAWFREITAGKMLVAGYNTYHALSHLDGTLSRSIYLSSNDGMFLDCTLTASQKERGVIIIGGPKIYANIAKRLNFDYILSYDLSCKISPSCSCFSRERGFDF